jgi:sensor histidine kinase regulating citrate/malate metabolism
VGGLLAIGEVGAARRLIRSVTTDQQAVHAALGRQISEPTVRGLLIAQAAIATQRGVRLTVTERSKLGALPPGLDEAGAVTVLGNMLDNALDAVAECPESRRKVTISFSSTQRLMRWRVRDYGCGVPVALQGTMFERGQTSKDGHEGLGLHLLLNVVQRAGGQLEVEHLTIGTAIRVSFPVSRTPAATPGFVPPARPQS